MKITAENLDFSTAMKKAEEGLIVCRKGWDKIKLCLFVRPADAIPLNFVATDMKSVPKSFKTFLHFHFAFHIQEAQEMQKKPEIDLFFSETVCVLYPNGFIENGYELTREDVETSDWFTYEASVVQPETVC